MMREFENAFADLADQLVPVVVSIKTEGKGNDQEWMDPLEQFFFGPGFRGEPRNLPKRQGLGSGGIVSSDGYILTNNHVIEGADQILVTLADQREFKAKLVGSDAQTDLAVIQIEKKPKDLPVAVLGVSANLRVGEWVLAIGNPFGLSHTVTSGIVSAKGVHNRGITSYENFIQTDAAINPGNSGGGLFNLNGELVGINTAILSRTGGFQGIGFAIPVDLAKIVMQDLIQNGKVSRGWLGVSIQNVDPKIAKAMKLERPRGALITEVFAGSPGAKAGLKEGDVVLMLNKDSIADANALRHSVAVVRPGQNARLLIWRNGKTMEINVKVGSREDAPEVIGEVGGSASWLGVEVAELDAKSREQAGLGKEENGVIVRSVKEGSIAESGGIVPQDIILQIGDEKTPNLAKFRQAVKKVENNETIVVRVKRGNGRLFLVLEKN